MDSREQFEAWMAGASLEPVDGAYGRAFWKAWQASREALVVQLPDGQQCGNWDTSWIAYDADEVNAALDKAGVRYE